MKISLDFDFDLGFTQVPNNLITSDLKNGEFRLLIYYMSKSGNYVFYRKTVAQELGISVKTISLFNTSLKEKGYLKIEKIDKENGEKEYKFTVTNKVLKPTKNDKNSYKNVTGELQKCNGGVTKMLLGELQKCNSGSYKNVTHTNTNITNTNITNTKKEKEKEKKTNKQKSKNKQISINKQVDTLFENVKLEYKKYWKNLGSKVPAKESKQKILNAIEKKKYNPNEIFLGLKNYLAANKDNDLKFVKGFVPFINQEIWKEYLEDVQEDDFIPAGIVLGR